MVFDIAEAMVYEAQPTPLKPVAIARIFGVRGYSGVSSTIRRVQAALQKGGGITRRYQQVSQFLET